MNVLIHIAQFSTKYFIGSFNMNIIQCWGSFRMGDPSGLGILQGWGSFRVGDPSGLEILQDWGSFRVGDPSGLGILQGWRSFRVEDPSGLGILQGWGSFRIGDPSEFWIWMFGPDATFLWYGSGFDIFRIADPHPTKTSGSGFRISINWFAGNSIPMFYHESCLN